MKNKSLMSDQELKRIRQLSSLVRELKMNNYDSFTWESAMDKVISENSRNEDDFFRMKALMGYFLNEEGQMQSFTIFMEGLDSRILDLKEKSKNYAISENDRKSLDLKISQILSKVEQPTDAKNAVEFYQLIIDKIFLSNDLDTLFSLLIDFAAVLNQHQINGFNEVHMLITGYQKIDSIIQVTKNGATKKEIVSEVPVSIDMGLFMNRLVKLGVFNQSKKGRENVYTFIKRDFENNLLRKEWTWLWAEPYKKLSHKIYEQNKYRKMSGNSLFSIFGLQ